MRQKRKRPVRAPGIKRVGTIRLLDWQSEKATKPGHVCPLSYPFIFQLCLVSLLRDHFGCIRLSRVFRLLSHWLSVPVTDRNTDIAILRLPGLAVTAIRRLL